MFCIIDLTLNLGTRCLFEHVNLVLNPGVCYGLVGANGAGKTTFLKVITGEISPTSGEIVKPKQMSVGVLRQDYYHFEKTRIIDVVVMGRERLWKVVEAKRLLVEKVDFSNEDGEKLSSLEEVFAFVGGYEAESQAASILEGLGIPQHKHEMPLSALSGGYKLRVLLAQLLFFGPDLLLLDEPTNYLDIVSIAWLETYLQTWKGAVVVCSHDRSFLNHACTEILDIDYKKVTVYKGNYDSFEEQKIEQSLQREALLEGFDKKQQHMQSFVDRFRAKSSKAKQAQSRVKALRRLEEEKNAHHLAPSCRQYPHFQFALSSRSGVIPLEIKGIEKAFGAHQVLKKVSLEVHRGDRVAIVGPNGVGKSTLLEILMGRLQADGGECTWASGVQLAYFPQYFARELAGFTQMLEYLAYKHPTASEQQLRFALGKMLFSGDDMHKRIEDLSGGEKARLVMANITLSSHNVLLLDEPTNHLDLEACEALQEALCEYEGTVIFVSHQRYFIEHVATRVFEITTTGVYDFRGSYEEYVERREKDYLDKMQASRQPVEKQKVTKDLPSGNSREKQKLTKQLQELETLCQAKELELQLLLEEIGAERFYTEVSAEQQKRKLQKKEELEVLLAKLYVEWDKLLNE